LKDPAFLFYPSDFLTGTMLMTDEQVGKYIRILCLQHQCGRLSDEDMLKICKTYDKDIYRKFLTDENGMYYNERLENEQIRRSAYSESRKANRLSKIDIKENHMSNICQSYVPHMVTETITVTKDINTTNKGGAGGKFKPPSLDEIKA